MHPGALVKKKSLSSWAKSKRKSDERRTEHLVMPYRLGVKNSGGFRIVSTKTRTKALNVNFAIGGN